MLHADEAVQWSLAKDAAGGAPYSLNEDKFHGPALAVVTQAVFALRGLGCDEASAQDLRDVPADGETMGEVMFRGNVVMKGYLKNPKASKEAFAGGWFHSGDLGVKHPDLYVQLKDRSKDIIISGGENISSIEVEDALFKHPSVQAAAVVARPDEKWGETPCAFIELKPGRTATAEELTQWCRERLAGFKCPRHFVFTELPKTSTGKIQKFVHQPLHIVDITLQKNCILAIQHRQTQPEPGQWGAQIMADPR